LPVTHLLISSDDLLLLTGAKISYKLLVFGIYYTVRHKKHTKILLCITSRNINRFSKFFHWWIQKICYKSLTTCPTTSRRRCCTTMWNRHVAKITL